VSNIINQKRCTSCLSTKEFIEFPKNKSKKDGLSCYCKVCNRIIQNKYTYANKDKISKKNKIDREKNPEKYKERTRVFYENNRDKILEKHKKYRIENSQKRLETCKKYRDNNKEKSAEYKRLYLIKNRPSLNFYAKKYINNKRKSDPLFRLICNLRKRIGSYCKRINIEKGFKTKECIGCNRNEFKEYFESKFTEGMTWENYGAWQVDHIKPISLATNEQEVKELNHYTNLQPLWETDNKRKSNNYG